MKLVSASSALPISTMPVRMVFVGLGHVTYVTAMQQQSFRVGSKIASSNQMNLAKLRALISIR